MSTIAASSGSVTAGLDEEIKKLDGLVDAVGKEVYTRIYNRTPVDTGYAQSRWRLVVGQEDFAVTNDAEYISYLENGHSSQAPHGMVAITMNEMPSIIAEKAKGRK